MGGIVTHIREGYLDFLKFVTKTEFQVGKERVRPEFRVGFIPDLEKFAENSMWRVFQTQTGNS